MTETKQTNKEIAIKDEIVEISKPKDMVDLAGTIKKLIVEKKLFTPMQGKNYINVEGWQLAGALTGIYPRVEKVERLPSQSGICYRAEVSLFKLSDGSNMGNGVAICSNTEPGKRNFAEYAVASMAQTRAIGKAYRLALGWLLKLAGYETTPAEEMTGVQTAEQKKPAQEAPTPLERKTLTMWLEQIGKTEAEIEEIQNKIDTRSKMTAALKRAEELSVAQEAEISQEVPETDVVIDANEV